MAYPYYPTYGNYAPTAPYTPQNALYQPQGPAPLSAAPAQNAQAQGTQGLSPASRLVSSREEAVAVPADFGGSLMLFPDITHNRIYTKRWNLQTGAADFIEFIPAPPEPVDVAPVVEYATVSDVQDLKDYLDDIYDEVMRLKNKGKAAKRSEPDE